MTNSEVKVTVIPEKKRRIFKFVKKVYEKRRSIYSGKVVKKVDCFGNMFLRCLKYDNE